MDIVQLDKGCGAFQKNTGGSVEALEAVEAVAVWDGVWAGFVETRGVFEEPGVLPTADAAGSGPLQAVRELSIWAGKLGCVEARGAFEEPGVLPTADAAGSGALEAVRKLSIWAGKLAGVVPLPMPFVGGRGGFCKGGAPDVGCVGEGRPRSSSNRGNGSPKGGVDVRRDAEGSLAAEVGSKGRLLSWPKVLATPLVPVITRDSGLCPLGRTALIWEVSSRSGMVSMDGSLQFSGDGRNGPSDEAFSSRRDSFRGSGNIGVVSTGGTPGPVGLPVAGGSWVPCCAGNRVEGDDAECGARCPVAWVVRARAGIAGVSGDRPRSTREACAAGGAGRCSSSGGHAGGSAGDAACVAAHLCPHLKLFVRSELASSVRALVLECMAGVGKRGVVVPIPEIGGVPATKRAS